MNIITMPLYTWCSNHELINAPSVSALKWLCAFALILNKVQCNAHPVHTDRKPAHFKYHKLISFFGGDRKRLKHSVELP